jgi:hypothetical protein
MRRVGPGCRLFPYLPGQSSIFLRRVGFGPPWAPCRLIFYMPIRGTLSGWEPWRCAGQVFDLWRRAVWIFR